MGLGGEEWCGNEEGTGDRVSGEEEEDGGGGGS